MAGAQEYAPPCEGIIEQIGKAPIVLSKLCHDNIHVSFAPKKSIDLASKFARKSTAYQRINHSLTTTG
jgi:hypothetical protein